MSDWVRSYLHTLRVLGNEAVHLRDKRDRLPRDLEPEDVLVLLANILRVLDFWQSLQGHGLEV